MKSIRIVTLSCLGASILLLAAAGMPDVKLARITEKLSVGKYEVTNREYQLFLSDLLASGKYDDLKKYLPDNKVFAKDFPATEKPMDEKYFSHPAFADYPVVGISHDAAVAFCEWLTQKSGSKQKYRLPTEKEWETIAKENNESAVYPGGQTKTTNEAGKYYFNYQPEAGNFTKDGFMYPAPVMKSLQASKKGIESMGGNVAEMVQEDGTAKGGAWCDTEEHLHITAQKKYTEPSSWLGFRVVCENN